MSGAQDELERAGDEPSISGRPSTIIASDISDAAQREAESIADPFGDDAPEIALLTEDEEERVSTPPPPPPEALAASASGNDDEDSVIELEGTEVEEELDEAADIEEDDEELELDEADVAEELPSSGRESGVPPEPPRDSLPGSRPAAPSAPAAAAPPSKPRPAAPAVPERKVAWFEEFFSDDYLRTVRPPGPRALATECNFIVDMLGIVPGTTVLDVGCGLGLHAIELAQRGALVVGLDLSLPMLSRAADEAQDRGLQINFLHGDMREMTFDGAFDCVLCWGTTFGYFEDEVNGKVMRRIYDALRPGGKLLLDVVNRDFLLRSQPNSVWFEGDGCVCMEETRVNPLTSRLEVRRNVMLDDGRQRDATYSLRVYSLHELGQVMTKAGFRVISVSGTMATPGVFFGADSPRMIVLAERRED